MGLDYVDIFYHHRPDPETPLEESMRALDHIVRSGKALYASVSNYQPPEMRKAIKILRDLGTPCLIHQPKYSMLVRWIEDELLDLLAAEGVGCIAFSPLAQGLLTDKYLGGIPAGSRASKAHGFLKPEQITKEMLDKVRKLNEIAKKRGQKLAQMAVAWVLRDKAMTTVLIGASRKEQIDDAVGALDRLQFSAEELRSIDHILQA
jgi:L-glyceraldehyde 3-phosphate reductase